MKTRILVPAILILWAYCARAAELTYTRPIPYPPGALDTRVPASESDTFIYHQIFSTLFTYNDGEITGDLVKKWKTLELGKRFELELIDAQFADGSKVTARDVAYSIERLRSSKGYMSQGFAPLDSVRIDNEKSLTIVLKSTNPRFLVRLSDPSTAIIREGSSTTDLNGSGPFRLSKRVNQSITLVKNGRYYGQKPQIDRLVLSIMPAEIAIRRFANNEVDDVFSYNVTAEQISKLGDKCNLFTERPPTARFLMIKSSEKGPLAQSDLRACLAANIDRRRISNIHVPGEDLMPALLPRHVLGGNLLKPYEVPPCSPEALFSLKKMTSSRPIRIATIAPAEKATEQVLSNELNKMGIKTELVIAKDVDEFLKNVRSEHVDVYIGKFTARTTEAESFLQAFLGKNAFFPVGRIDKYIDTLATNFEAIAGHQERAAAVANVFNEVAKQNVMIPLSQFQLRGCSQKKWEGVSLPQLGYIYQDFRSTKLK